MTRINARISVITAIILCILIVFSSVCPFVTSSEGKNRDTQFFAANLYLVFSQTVTSLSSNGSARPVSWIRSREPLYDAQITDREKELTFSYTVDSPRKYNSPVNIAFPQKCGPSRYFMRI